MPHYVFLVKITEQGVRTLKDSPKRSEDFEKAVVAHGGKVTSFLHTMGTYDAIVATELPSDEVANQLALGVGMLGNARTVTLKGWTTPEYRQLIEALYKKL